MTNSHIKKLPANLVCQIAAGEVVERPSSAVKELIDNSIDAGAKNIQVQILSNDGRSFRVTDDGSGIHPDDIELAFSDHATSKIQSFEDLSNLITKGFRGEALSSIASVAEVTCFTKHHSTNMALKAFVDKEGKIHKSPAAFARGTSFEIRNLFGSLPVRLKFLKRPETEIQAIQDVVKEAAIAHPEISFEFQNKDKVTLKTSGSGSWEQTVKEVLQEKINFKYLEVVREEEPIIELRGLIAPLTEARSDSKAIVTLVNQRPIQCDIMRKAIRAVYQGFLPAGKYPRIILSLSLPPGQIDVNVHPNKKEIRYAAPNVVFQLVQNALEKHLILNANLNSLPKSLLEHAQESSIQHPPDSNSTRTTFEREPLQVKVNFPTQLEQNLQERPPSEVIHKDKEELIFSSANNSSQEADTNILQISELELKKHPSSKSDNSYKAERGNSTDFCLRSGSFSISGQVSGPQWIRSKYLESLFQLVLTVDLEWDAKQKQTEQIQVFPAMQTRRPKVSNIILEEVWERDGWRCVYCGKYLLHPQLVKQAMRQDPESWVNRLGSNNQLVKTHLLREHQATYDHYLPYSHNPSLAQQKDNLHACCRACNQAKSNSTDQLKWQTKKFDSWTSKEVILGKLSFTGGNKEASFNKVVE
jgi:DNA mismatch repair protein MutL